MSGSKQQVLFIHGGDSFSNHEDFLNYLKTTPLRYPKGDGKTLWNRSLRQYLGEDFDFFQLSMPNSTNAKYEEWKIWFERHLEFLKGDVILVGWSLGGMFLLKYLSEEELPIRLKSLIIVASPSGRYEIDTEPGNDCLSFQFELEKLREINNKVNLVVIMHSKDDFVVPYEHALKLKEALPEAELVTFEDKNHFLIEEFPELIEKIKSL